MNALPADLARNPRLDRWLRIRAEGLVEVRVGKVEIGQGIATALAAIAADALGVARRRVKMVPACTDESPDEGMTSGSLSTQEAGAALRQACTEARAIYLRAAAERLGVDAATVRVEEGEFLAGDARTSYWALADDARLARDACGEPRAATRGTSLAQDPERLDLPAKIRAEPRFVHDLRLPGMLHGRIVRPPSPAARLGSLDEASARELRGVVAIVRDGDFLGVVAEREEVAVRAADRLARHARWNEPATLPEESAIGAWLRSQAAETTLVAASGEPPARVARTLRASFSRPYLAHASLGPSCAVAQWREGRLHAWSHAQGPFNLRDDLARAFRIPPDRVVVAHREGAGCYGHNGADDVALDAALLARAVGDRPVRVAWSRADELTAAPFGPAMAVDIAVALDAAGEVLHWETDVYSNGHSLRPGRAETPTLLAAAHLGEPFPRRAAINMPLATGGGAERNAVPLYGFPAIRVRSHRVLEMPLRTSALRSLGAFANVFAIESLVDEIARAKGDDPVAWRLRHLADPRARDVLSAAAASATWRDFQRGEGLGRGIAFARYKGNGAWCAVAARVALTHEVRVTHLAIAADVGYVVSRDGVANQLEGGAVQATSWTLKEAVRFDRTRVTSDAWERYPILRASEAPRIEIALVESGGPSVGAGEAAQGPTAAAIANAVFDAVGARVRDLPITPGRIAAA